MGKCRFFLFSIVKIDIYIKLIKDHVGVLDNLLTYVAT